MVAFKATDSKACRGGHKSFEESGELEDEGLSNVARRDSKEVWPPMDNL